MELTFTVDGRVYSWVGGYGAIFTSKEHGCSMGETRVINHELFYVYMITTYGLFGKPTVGWTQIDVTIEHIREIRAKFFGC